ncbi:MAG: hypothetical protein OXU69_00425 [Gemmatimonadota bacterium]|nr:hypothetical protein [Gemmatimonadota bacterium]MDE2983141.1 hypothetical protein [Gemmatimonadota bacterium]
MATQCSRFSVILALVVLLIPPTLEAQALYDDSVVEAVIDVLEWLDGDDYTLMPEFGQWGLVFGWFSEGEQKDIDFTVTAGERYMIVGGGDNNVDDIDICIYDETGREVDCDTAIDNFPLVSFIAHSGGTWSASLIAYSLNSSTAYAGMALLHEY